MRATLILVLGAALLAPAVLVACGDDDCKTDDDCPAGNICRVGLCAPDPTAPDTLIPDGADVNLDCDPATPGDLVLNEILADPPAGVDINGDGEASSRGDEFVELVNVSNRDVSPLNVQVGVGGSAVAAGVFCIAPNEARVIFGAEGLPQLTNSSGTVTLLVDGEIDQTHTYGSEGGRDLSMTLAVQLDPASGWVLHDTVAATPFSPGTCANGNDFPNCDGPGPVEQDGDVADGTDVVAACSELPVAGDLVINEILADPGTVNDANQDGAFSSTEDEFVEIVNVSAKTLLLTGVTLSEGGGQVFTFPTHTCIAPDQAAVMFGSYEGGGDFGGALPFGHGRSFGLNNTGDTVALRDGAGATLDEVTYGSAAGDDQAVVREIDGDIAAAFVKHSLAAGSGGALMSPGRCTTGAAFPNCGGGQAEVAEGDPDAAIGDTTPTEVIEDVGPSCGPAPLAGDLVVNEIMAHPGGVKWSGDATDDGSINLRHEYVEILNVSDHAIEAEGVQLLVGTNVRYTVGDRGEATTCLAAGEGILVFGGGTPTLAPAGVVVVAAGATSGLSLTDGGQTITLRSAGTDINSHTYGASGEEMAGRSWVRDPDGSGAFVDHSGVVGAVGNGSPGTCTNGGAFPACLE